MSKTMPLPPVIPVAEPVLGNDITSLYSTFSAFTQGPSYKEVVREEGARIAIERWPLLAELYGYDISPLIKKTSA